MNEPGGQTGGWSERDDDTHRAELIARPLAAPASPRPTASQRRRVDPWAHRRGEPRIFALLWTMFLFAATALTMLSAVARGIPGIETMRPAARTLMVTVAAGIGLAWPMIRLSQRRDRSPIAGGVQDLVVLLVPVQAVLWPQSMWWLARWPTVVIAALSAELAAWALLIGGVIALAYALERVGGPEERPDQAGMAPPLARWGWMAAIAVLVVGGALPAMAGVGLVEGNPATRAWWMISPLTGVLELSRDWTWAGGAGRVEPVHWAMIALTAGAAIPLWAAAAVMAARRRPAGGRG